MQGDLTLLSPEAINLQTFPPSFAGEMKSNFPREEPILCPLLLNETRNSLHHGCTIKHMTDSIGIKEKRGNVSVDCVENDANVPEASVKCVCGLSAL